MTAIAIAYTPDGFVIGADGRQVNFDGTVVSENSQKIIEYSALNVRAAGAWSGTLQFDDGVSSFDIKTHTLEIAESVKLLEFASAEEYAQTIAGHLFDRFSGWLNSARGSVGSYTGEVARMALVGYVNGSPEQSSIFLNCEDGILSLPGIGSPIDPLSPRLQVFSGNKAVFLSMHALGGSNPCSSLADCRDKIKTYIERCANQDDAAGNTIGGHIHIAAATPQGVLWLVPPAP